MPCGKQRQPDSRAVSEVVDALKGAALIATFIGFLSIFATWVLLWENVWRVSVEPVRGAIYDARLNRLGPSPCLRSSWMWWRTAGCRLI
jgi:hypothetical protein